MVLFAGSGRLIGILFMNEPIPYLAPPPIPQPQYQAPTEESQAQAQANREREVLLQFMAAQQGAMALTNSQQMLNNAGG